LLESEGGSFILWWGWCNAIALTLVIQTQHLDLSFGSAEDTEAIAFT
jgi:hypothetical protein